jgi:uncharacterized protein (TIGR02246 family)
LETSEPVIDVIVELVASWNAHDAPAFGALFTEDAKYIGTDGISHRGRAAIVELLRHADRRSRVSIDGPVTVGFDDDGARALFRWVTQLEDKGRRGTIDCLMVQREEGWRIDALRNSDAAGES